MCKQSQSCSAFVVRKSKVFKNITNFFAMLVVLLYISSCGRRNEMSSDFFLIQKIRNGDRQTGNQFIEKYYSSIYQYCYLHIHDKECAEDITQEIFMKFFEAVMKNVDIRRIRSYLYSISANVIKNYYKKKKELLLDQVPDLAQNRLTEIDIKLDIEQAVDHLPEEIKETAILFFFQELKQREIADLLNIKLSLVKYRVSVAKKLLSKQLEVDIK